MCHDLCALIRNMFDVSAITRQTQESSRTYSAHTPTKLVAIGHYSLPMEPIVTRRYDIVNIKH
jgi:hypothetical protein